MDLAIGIEPITNLKSKAAELIRKTRKSGQPLVITQNGKPSAVLIDVESYQKLRNSLMLLKILSQGDQEYRTGKTLTHKQAKKILSKTLNKLK